MRIEKCPSPFLELGDHRVFRWQAPFPCQHLYFTSASVTHDDRWLVALREDNDGIGLSKVNRASGELTPLHESMPLMYSYVYGAGQFRKGFSKSSPILDERRNTVYWIQNQSLMACGLDGNGRPCKLTDLPEGWVSAFNHVSPEGDRLVVPLTHPKAFSEAYSTQLDQMRYVPPRMVNRGYVSKLLLVNVANGEISELCEVPFWVTHVQFDPLGSGRILFNSEGSYWMTGDPHIRIWVAETDGTIHPLSGQPSDEECSHENFSPDGNSVIYHGTHRAGDDFVASRALDGSLLWEIPTPDFHPFHAVATRDRPGFTADTKEGEVILCHIEEEGISRKLLCRHDSNFNNQDDHPHPRMNPNANGVIITSSCGERRAIYEIAL